MLWDFNNKHPYFENVTVTYAHILTLAQVIPYADKTKTTKKSPPQLQSPNSTALNGFCKQVFLLMSDCAFFMEIIRLSSDDYAYDCWKARKPCRSSAKINQPWFQPHSTCFSLFQCERNIIATTLRIIFLLQKIMHFCASLLALFLSWNLYIFIF